MSEPLPERPDVRQLRLQAKEFLDSLHAGSPEALALAAEHDPSLVTAEAKLSDAQRLLARKHGFSSWPKLVEEVETPQLRERMRLAIEGGDAAGLDALLRQSATLRREIDEPMFTFDTPSFVQASRHPKAKELLPVLAKHGANPNARSRWWAGPFGALDGARDETVDLLLQLGTRWDVRSAAAHGRLDVVREILDADPSLVNETGGDGQTALHVAKTPEVAELLMARGASLEQRDVDHEATPAQYQIGNPEVLRVLLRHGAKPDVFIAAALDDVELLHRTIQNDPSALNARVGEPPFVCQKSDGGHIYVYRIGNGKTPIEYAAERGSQAVLTALLPLVSLGQRLVAAAWRGDEAAVDAMLAEHPQMGRDLEPGEVKAIGNAAMQGRTETVRLLLKAGVDPATPGMDSGSSLHVAAWFGWLDVVRLLIPHVAIESRDSTHGSTPLGWAAHGAQWCHNARGDYPAVVETLLQARADVHASANSDGTPILKQAGTREDVKAVLRRYGAV